MGAGKRRGKERRRAEEAAEAEDLWARTSSSERRVLERLTEAETWRRSGEWSSVRLRLPDRPPDDAELGLFDLVRPNGAVVKASQASLRLQDLHLSTFRPARLHSPKWPRENHKKPSQADFRRLYAEPFGDHRSVQLKPGDFRDGHYESLLGLQWAVNADPLHRLVACRVQVPLPASPRPHSPHGAPAEDAKVVWEWRRALVFEAKERSRRHSHTSFFNCLVYLVDADLWTNARAKDLRWLPKLWCRGLAKCLRLRQAVASLQPPLGSQTTPSRTPAADALPLNVRLAKESLLEGLVRVLGPAPDLVSHNSVPVTGVSVFKRHVMVDGPRRKASGALGPLLLDPHLFHVLPTPLALERQTFFDRLQSSYGDPGGPSEVGERYRVPVGVVERALGLGEPVVAVAWLPVFHNFHQEGYDERECPWVGNEDHRVRDRCWYRVRVVGYAEEAAVLPGVRRPVRGLLEVEELDSFAIPGVEDVRFVVRSRDLFFLCPALALQPIPRYYATIHGLDPVSVTLEGRHLLSHVLLGLNEPSNRHSVPYRRAFPDLLKWQLRRKALQLPSPEGAFKTGALELRVVALCEVSLVHGQSEVAQVELRFQQTHCRPLSLLQLMTEPMDGEAAFAAAQTDPMAPLDGLVRLCDVRRRLFGVRGGLGAESVGPEDALLSLITSSSDGSQGSQGSDSGVVLSSSPRPSASQPSSRTSSHNSLSNEPHSSHASSPTPSDSSSPEQPLPLLFQAPMHPLKQPDLVPSTPSARRPPKPVPASASEAEKKVGASGLVRSQSFPPMGWEKAATEASASLKRWYPRPLLATQSSASAASQASDGSPEGPPQGPPEGPPQGPPSPPRSPSVDSDSESFYTASTASHSPHRSPRRPSPSQPRPFPDSLGPKP